MHQLRDYQQRAADAIYNRFQEEPGASVLCVMPTGTGKTIVFCNVAERLGSEGRIMIMAHRKELIDQAAKKYVRATGETPAIEMAADWANHGFERNSNGVITSVQTQISGMGGKGRMSQFPPSAFRMLVVDEAHHAAAKSYRRVIKYYRGGNPGLSLLGVTATPDRHDEKALGLIFGECVFDYELPDAIADGWLVPIEQQFVDVEGIDLSEVKTVAGDLNQGELSEIMEQERNLHEVAYPTLDIVGDRKTLVFTTRVHHAERLAEIFCRHRPNSAEVVSQKTPRKEREEIFRRFAEGDIQFLCNVGVATEGYDCPGIEVVAVARPTKSRALYAQMIGRGTRALTGVLDPFNDMGPPERREAIAESRKKNLLVLDYVGNAGRHKLVSTADVLGGNYTDEEIEEAAKQVRESGGSEDMTEALDEARKKLQEERRLALEARRMRHLQKRAMIRPGVKYESRHVDPFDALDMVRGRLRGWDTMAPVTEAQSAVLERFGLDPSTEIASLTKKEAGQLISRLITGRKAGLATFKQSRLLRRYGVSTRGLTFQEASSLIDALARNRWKVPAGGIHA
jgi:superfamily II DNA or RNA helicase